MTHGCAEGKERTSSLLRREDLAIRTVAASLRSALREIDRSAPSAAREQRVAAVVAWARDSVGVHEQAVARLKRSAVASRGNGLASALDAGLEEVRGVIGAAERTLARRGAAALRR